MNNTRFLRNKDLINVENLKEVTVIGLGGIGSFLIQTLGIMGFQIVRGYDDDAMESHNLSSTAYDFDDVGLAKVKCAEKLWNRVTSPEQRFYGIEKRFGLSDKTSPNMIICTDDMESRKIIYRMWWNRHGKTNPNAWIVDARMGATSIEVVTCKGIAEQNYFEHWIPTSSVPPAPCSMKHTVFATTNVVSIVASQVHSLVANLCYYDYIWSSLSPITIHYGTLIVPNINNKETHGKSTQSADGLGDNALRTDLLLHWSAKNR